MPSSQTHSLSPSCATLLQSFLQVEGLPFAAVLTAEHCRALFQREGLADAALPCPEPAPRTPAGAADAAGAASRPPASSRADGADARTPGAAAARAGSPDPRCPVWTTALTLWTFLQQTLSTSKACTAAVLRAVVLRTALGCPPPAANPGGYSKARRRLPTRLVQDLSLDLALRLEAALPEGWRWRGRRVWLVDGWVVTLPDTPANQRRYPQPTSQKPGAGFPQLRVVGLFSRASGLVAGVKYGPCVGKETGEGALFRELFAQLRPGDVVVADRSYCSYFLIALLQRRGVDVVLHQHQRRQHTFGQGQALGAEDELVVWDKPKRPGWLDEATYAALPATLQVRITATRVETPGFRTQYLRVVTSLCDGSQYSREAIVSLYRERWGVEGLIRSLKTYQGMEELRCKTPEMVEKELWVNLLAYNLTRKVMCQAAARHGVQPGQLSFTATARALEAYRQSLATAPPEGARALGQQLLDGMKSFLIVSRPDRVEPRLKKRRPKQYGRLTKPRAQARAEVRSRPGGERRRKDWRRQPGEEAAPWVG